MAIDEDASALLSGLNDGKESKVVDAQSTFSAREVLDIIFKDRRVEVEVHSASELKEYNKLFSNLNVIKSRDNKLIRELDLLEKTLVIKKRIVQLESMTEINKIDEIKFPVKFIIWADKAPAPRRYAGFKIVNNDG